MTRAILAKRSTDSPVNTDEIEALARAAGFEVADVLTQVRPEDPGTHLGRGKLETAAARVRETDAGTVVVDGDLTPGQHRAIGEAMPDGTRVLDRHRLILEIFGDQAESRRAQLQVELAQLKYDLPRIREESDEGLMNRFTESGTPLYDVRDRIDRLERKLAELPDPAERHREARREAGFDLVTIAGYTNAGKSTLLHRLADELDLPAAEPDHEDLTGTAEIEDRLFKTLETTTRRATLEGREVLLTDTVGFVSELPHWLVASFSETLSEAGAADAVVLVTDASDPLETFERKCETALAILDEQDAGPIVPVLNKVDLVDGEALASRRETLAEMVDEPVLASATEQEGLHRLEARILSCLPTERTELTMPACDEAMGVVSWAHDHAAVERVEYGERIELEARGRPSVIDRLAGKARSI